MHRSGRRRLVPFEGRRLTFEQAGGLLTDSFTVAWGKKFDLLEALPQTEEGRARYSKALGSLIEFQRQKRKVERLLREQGDLSALLGMKKLVEKMKGLEV